MRKTERKVNEITRDLVYQELLRHGFLFLMTLGMIVFSDDANKKLTGKIVMEKEYAEGYRVFMNYNNLVTDRKTRKGIKRDLEILLMTKPNE